VHHQILKRSECQGWLKKKKTQKANQQWHCCCEVVAPSSFLFEIAAMCLFRKGCAAGLHALLCLASSFQPLNIQDEQTLITH
jgi:hypothetical protein